MSGLRFTWNSQLSLARNIKRNYFASAGKVVAARQIKFAVNRTSVDAFESGESEAAH